MSVNSLDEYWVPEHVKEYLRRLGFVLPLDDMEPWIRSWDDWMGARGDFYDYRDKDGMGRVYEVHRRSIHPAMRVCKEWGSLLLNEEVKVVCEDQKTTDWIGGYFSNTGFMAQAQDTVVRAFGLGTGVWALWLDLDRKKVRIRHYDARMVIPLTWDEDGIMECAFVTRAFYRGKAVDQLQMHLKGGVSFSAELSPSSPSAPSPSESSADRSHGLVDMDNEGTYRIVTVCFDKDGNELAPMGVAAEYDTGCPFPTSISSKVAGAIGAHKEYVKKRGLDAEICKELILKVLATSPCSRAEIIAAIDHALPQDLSLKQKQEHVSYLLKSLKRSGKIALEGNTSGSVWKLIEHDIN